MSGAGKLNAADAVNVAATLEPAAISFGPITTLPINRNLTLTNVSGATATFSITVRQLTSDSNAQVTVSQSSVTADGGPEPADHRFAHRQQAGGGRVRRLHRRQGRPVPICTFPTSTWWAAECRTTFSRCRTARSLGVPNDFGWRLAVPRGGSVWCAGGEHAGIVPDSGGRREVQRAGGDKTTDALGNAGVFVDLGPQQGDQIFTGTAGGLTQEFDGLCAPPAHHQERRRGERRASVPGGSGTGSRDRTSRSSAAIFPMPRWWRAHSRCRCRWARFRSASTAAGRACRATSTSSVRGQINVQIPWEFQGQSSVQMKVTLYGYLWGDLYTVPLDHLFAGHVRRHGWRQQCGDFGDRIRPNAAEAS